MNIEKLKQIRTLIDECISEYQGEEEGEESSETDIGDSTDPSPSGSGNDKIKMAVAMMRRGK